MSRLLVSFLVGVLAIQFSLTANAFGNPNLKKVEYRVEAAQSLGGNPRGPALAVLADGSALLGGGDRGGTVFLWRESEDTLAELGDLIKPTQRLRDSRFAITDILVLSQGSENAEVLVSFPRMRPTRCIELVVYRASINLLDKSLQRQERWFRSSPCVPISAVQHAAGRMEFIDSKSAYLTVGDLGYIHIDDKRKRGDLGSLFRITKNKITKISTGHRNQQGIVLLPDKTLLTSEHGPRGGDEINLIKKGVDYGWPFVTYGAPYSIGDYIIPKSTGTHSGYREPIRQWNPSIAPTELIRLPDTGYGELSGWLVMGTLREQSLVFLKYQDGAISSERIIRVGARIRDLDLMPDGRIVATSDDGKLLMWSVAN